MRFAILAAIAAVVSSPAAAADFYRYTISIDESPQGVSAVVSFRTQGFIAPGTGGIVLFDDEATTCFSPQGPCSTAIGIYTSQTAFEPNDNFIVGPIGSGVASITFAAGAFQNLGSSTSIDTPNSGVGSLFVQTATGVPEPSTWALMVLSFGAVAGAMRARRRRLVHA